MQFQTVVNPTLARMEAVVLLKDRLIPASVSQTLEVAAVNTVRSLNMKVLFIVRTSFIRQMR